MWNVLFCTEKKTACARFPVFPYFKYSSMRGKRRPIHHSDKVASQGTRGFGRLGQAQVLILMWDKVHPTAVIFYCVNRW